MTDPSPALLPMDSPLLANATTGIDTNFLYPICSLILTFEG